MKLTLKDLVKLIAPYLVAIGWAIEVYADSPALQELKIKEELPYALR